LVFGPGTPWVATGYAIVMIVGRDPRRDMIGDNQRNLRLFESCPAVRIHHGGGFGYGMAL
jgi:hypothetical protein